MLKPALSLTGSVGRAGIRGPLLRCWGLRDSPPAARQAEPWVQQAYLARQRERLEKQLKLHLAHSGPLSAQAGQLGRPRQEMALVRWQPVGWQLRCGSGGTHPAPRPAGQWLLPANLGPLRTQFMPGAMPIWCIRWCCKHVLQAAELSVFKLQTDISA